MTLWAIGIAVFTESEALAAAFCAVGVLMLFMLGWRSGNLQELTCAFLVPLAALLVDVLTFSPLSHQAGSEANIYTPIAAIYMPVWLALVGGGVVAARIKRRGGGHAAPVV